MKRTAEKGKKQNWQRTLALSFFGGWIAATFLGFAGMSLLDLAEWVEEPPSMTGLEVPEPEPTQAPVTPAMVLPMTEPREPAAAAMPEHWTPPPLAYSDS